MNIRQINRYYIVYISQIIQQKEQLIQQKFKRTSKGLMNFLRQYFYPTQQQTILNLIQCLFSQLNIVNKLFPLPTTYQYSLGQTLSKVNDKGSFLKMLVNKVNGMRAVSQIVKGWTLIINTMENLDYNKEIIQNIQVIKIPNLQDQDEKKWFYSFASCYANYLRKITSVSDIYYKCKVGILIKTDQSFYLTQVYRVINHISIIFPQICTLVNTIGRYYLSSYPQFPQFYRSLIKQLTSVYSYLKQIIQEILLCYRIFNLTELECFVLTIPQIELICDKMEDLLLNKYFKGKPIKGKIYFKEEKVLEIKYFLQYQVKQTKSSRVSRPSQNSINSPQKSQKQNKSPQKLTIQPLKLTKSPQKAVNPKQIISQKLINSKIINQSQKSILSSQFIQQEGVVQDDQDGGIWQGQVVVQEVQGQVVQESQQETISTKD